MQNQALLEDLIPLSKFNEYCKYPTVNALRQMLFYGKNGVRKIQVKIGKRIYISLSEFEKWIKEQNENN